jgi:hypothetical protein
MLYTFILFQNLVYEMWKNIIQPVRPQMTIWHMRIACWIHKATNTLRICNISFFSTRQWLHDRASMLRYTVRTFCVTRYYLVYH